MPARLPPTPHVEPSAFVDWAYQAVLRRPCDPGDRDYLASQIQTDEGNARKLLERLLTCDEYRRRFEFCERTAFPDGHFYSPIPSDAEVSDYVASRPRSPDALGVELNIAEQTSLLAELQPLYADIPFQDRPSSKLRYGYENDSYVHGDAIFLHLLIRWLQPARLIEIGSGNSSCVTLDTNDLFFGNRILCTFIEPFPQLLRALVKASDDIELLPHRLQEIDLGLFEKLGPRDILFVDSTHVSKLNSDVNRLFFEILPRLKPGVFIHIHDVFPGFEYPEPWLAEGRAWNEQYLLRAFLQYNTNFKVRMFPGLLTAKEPKWFEDNMPLVLKNPGGSIWLEKVH